MTKPWWTRALLGRTTVSNPLQTDDAPDPQFEAQWRSLVKKRLFLIFSVLAIWVAGVECRLIWIQAVDHHAWAEAARKQREATEEIAALRGDILDRHGRLLAYSVPSYELHVSPRFLFAKESAAGAYFNRDTKVFARALCQALGDCDADEEKSILAKIEKQRLDKDTDTLKPIADVVIRRARQMSPDAAAGIKELVAKVVKKHKYQAVIELWPEQVRTYPNLGLAAQLIGYMNATGAGTFGAERQFDQLLRGTPGRQVTHRDGYRQEILTNVLAAPKPGTSLELTIDLAIQEIAERELAREIVEAGAQGGTVVVLDSATGEVLALANLPSFNPNVPLGNDPGERNRATQDLNEPGSTFKIITLAAALNEGIVNTSTVIDTYGGRFTVEGRSKPITEDKGHNYGPLNVEGILVKSSNIGAARIGLQLGPDLLQRYAVLFGVGLKEGARDFFAERLGRIYVPPGGLRKADLAVVSYGYGVTASPLQMAAAMNVFATGGVLMRPRLVRATIDGNVRRVREPEAIGRAISPQTASTMMSMLEGVIEDPTGTGKNAALTRYRVGGKTGTTKKNLGNGKGYSETDYLVSFAGIAPTRHPRFTIVVVIDRPTKKPAYGGAVSAPVFKRVAEAALNYVGEPPSVNPPPAVIVANERPKGVRPVETPVFVDAGGVMRMPDLTGLTLRDARRRLPAGMTVNSKGDGVVVSQSPAAGEALVTDQATLRLDRQPASANARSIKTGGSGR